MLYGVLYVGLTLMSWFSNFWNCLLDAAENALNCVQYLPEIILKQVVIVIALLWFSGADHYFTYSKKRFSGVDSMFIFQWGCEVSHDVFHKYYHRSQAFLLYLCECSIFNVSFAFWHLGECRCCLKKDSCRKWYLEPGCYYQKLWLAFCTIEINKSWVYCNSGNRFLKK